MFFCVYFDDAGSLAVLGGVIGCFVVCRSVGCVVEGEAERVCQFRT